MAPGTDLAGTTDVYASLPLRFDPGTHWNYSVATNVLGRIIEVVSGLPSTPTSPSVCSGRSACGTPGSR